MDPAFDFRPELRSDASRCDPEITKAQANAALRDAIRAGCVSDTFVGAFPQYVWGRIAGVPHIARLINSEAGWYKGWPITDLELPDDPGGRIDPKGVTS